MLETLVIDFSGLLSEIHSLRASLGIVVTTLLVLKEGLIPINSGLSLCDLLVISITRSLGCDNLTWDVKKIDSLGFFNDNIDVSVELFGAETTFGSFGGLFGLLSLGFFVLRSLHKGA